jgi:hypothetical protein
MKLKKASLMAILVVGTLLATAAPSHAWWRWWGSGVWVVPPPVVITPAPAPGPVVVTPAPVIESAPAYAEPEPSQGYWYFCPSSRAYYPSVQTCPEVWVKVPPRAQQ